MLHDIVSTVTQHDPVRGVWAVRKASDGVVWCDASSIAVRVLLEIDDNCVEDGCWLRKTDDAARINLAELEAVIRFSYGVLLASSNAHW